jgi:hypothetical protein
MKLLRSISLLGCVGVYGAGFAATWNVPGDFATIQAAIDSPLVAATGDTIRVGSGEHAGALVTKAVAIVGEGNARITSGPMHPAGLSQGFRLLFGASGATFSHLTFTTDLSIMNGASVDDVTVTQCTFLNSIQAISNWGGCRWEITHNTITDLRTDCGGGIGILIADRTARPLGVTDNVVSHNTITGQLNVPADDCGGYNGSGIVLYADFRWGAAGAESISFNRVVKNKVSMTLNNLQPTPTVDIVAFELTDTRVAPGTDVIFSNSIGFNDWRGTALQEALTPLALDTVNDFSRNFGTSRGQGAHPGAFGPGGN